MLPSETAKTVNCELLSENSNSVMTWVHPLPDGRLFTVVSMSKPLSPHNTLPQDQFLFGRFSEDGGRTWDNPFYLYTWPEKIASMLYAGSLLDSRGHLYIEPAGETVNPTCVDGRPIRRRVDLHAGSAISMGEITLVVKRIEEIQRN